MRRHNTYTRIAEAVNDGRLREPFGATDVRSACPDIAPTTPGAFLAKHRRGNPESL